MRSKLYIVLLGVGYNRDKLTEYLSSTDISDFWFYNMPYSIFIKTRLTPTQLSGMIQSRFGKHFIFITEVTRNTDGLLNKDQWDLILKYRDYDV